MIIIKVLKATIILFFTLSILLTLVVLFDFANYDSSYLNRNSITFSINNVNSKKTRKIFHLLNNFYSSVAMKIFKDEKEYWKTEDSSLRSSLPKVKIIPKKIEIFFPGEALEDIEKNFSNWPRSHGGS